MGYLTRVILGLMLVSSARVAVAQNGALDTALVHAIEERVLSREHYMIDGGRVRFSDEVSHIIPGLHYRWADYSYWDTAVTSHYFAAAAIGLAENRVVQSAADWGAVVGSWGPRTPTEAKNACVEMFRIVRSDAGPGLDRYMLYEPPTSPLPEMEASEERYLRRRMRSRSVVRALTSPARWEVEVWAFSGGGNETGHRVRCTLPRMDRSTPSSFRVEIARTVQAPANPLLM